MSRADDLAVASVLLGHRVSAAREPQVDGPQIGKITKVAAVGASFTIEDYDGGVHVFGPAPYSKGGCATTDGHTHSLLPPTVGATCLVVFVGTGIDKPWVISWIA